MSEQAARASRIEAVPSPDGTATAARGQVWVAYLFLISLLAPFHIQIGSLLLMPHRAVIVIFFIPFFVILFILKRAGPVLLFDWLMFGSAVWVGPALLAHLPVAQVIEPFGIHMVEFFGAYLIARVSIRSAEDFRRVVRLFFFILLFLLPFAAVESITRKPVLLDLIPGTGIGPVDAGVRMNMRRAQTIFAHPILFGTFASTGLGLFWYALRPRWLRFPAVPIVALNTIFSLSTGALVSFVMQCAFIGWEVTLKTMRSRWRLFAALSVAGYVIVDLLSNRSPFHVLVTYATFSTNSAYTRILIWRYGTDNVWDNPFFGLGFNDWARPSWMGPSIDNFWLLIAMRYGLPAIIMAVVALTLILRRVALAELVTEQDRLCRAAYLTAFGGVVIAGGTVHYWHAMMAFVLFIFGSGVWAATGGGVSRGADTSAEPDMPPPRLSAYTRQPAPGQSIGRARRRRVQSAARTDAPYRR